MRLLEEEGSLLDVDVKFVGTGGGSTPAASPAAALAAIDACGPVCASICMMPGSISLLDTVEPRLQLLMNVIQNYNARYRRSIQNKASMTMQPQILNILDIMKDLVSVQSDTGTKNGRKYG